MIEIMFNLGTEVILVVINKNDIRFGNTSFGARLTDIGGLKLDYKGVCREFPDLEMKYNWKEEAIRRFKEKIALFKTEKEKANYIIEDLKKYGYVLRLVKRQGFRPEKTLW